MNTRELGTSLVVQASGLRAPTVGVRSPAGELKPSKPHGIMTNVMVSHFGWEPGCSKAIVCNDGLAGLPTGNLGDCNFERIWIMRRNHPETESEGSDRCPVQVLLQVWSQDWQHQHHLDACQNVQGAASAHGKHPSLLHHPSITETRLRKPQSVGSEDEVCPSVSLTPNLVLSP